MSSGSSGVTMPHSQSQPMQAGPSGSRKRRPSQSPSRSDDEPRPEKKQKTKAALFVQKLNRKRENHKKTQKPKEQSRTSHHVTSKEIPQDAEETKVRILLLQI